MKTIKEELPIKGKLIDVYLWDGTQCRARAFEGGSGVYHIEPEDFDDKRYWCQGEMKPGCNLNDIEKWEYV